jgi:hypothetical protein
MSKAETRRNSLIRILKETDTISLSLVDGIDTETDLLDLMVDLEGYKSKHTQCGLLLNRHTQSLAVSQNVSLISNYLEALEATQFERYIALLVKIFGYDLTFATKISHDQGIDFMGVKEFKLFDSTRKSFLLGQAKKYNTLVNVEEIRNFAGSLFLMRSREFSQVKPTYSSVITKSFTPIEGLFATSYFFSPPALNLCHNSDIICLDFIDIVMLTEKAILTKDLAIETNDIFDAAKTDLELQKIKIMR